ncbi:peptidase inhibitor family I36 protein [Microbacterium ureisolvens]|uniref:Peptidase inhibitor family I36 protein n=1 Tax=Microbacterium ureisolvens TaxID=2781186 RepID=A0ABS7HZY1_9MICO|nr:peptidase inhibitor family I36 protein [Microbacterium ureisolvens]MBW9110161.1 peptidase inhibitor family I36 protein [Microbacterium ureisolvens]
MSDMQRTQKKPRRRIGAIIAAASLLAAGLLGVTSPAQAASSDCGSGRACAWSGYDYGVDGFWGWTSWQYCYNDFTGGSLSNDKASSFYNNGNAQVARMYQYLNAGGPYISRPIKSGYPDLNTVSFNDRATSGYFYNYIGSAGTSFCN